MNKKKLLLGGALTMCAAIATVALVVPNTINGAKSKSKDTMYTLNVASSPFNEVEQKAKSFIRKTTLGNDIGFATSSNKNLAPSDGYFCSMKGNSHFSNTTAINKVTQIKIELSEVCDFRIFYSEVSGNFPTNQKIDCANKSTYEEDMTSIITTETPYCYFQIRSMSSSEQPEWINVINVSFTYEC